MDEKRAKFCLSLFFSVTVFIQLKSCGAAVEAGDTLSLGASLTGNQTIISKNRTFELGFFSPNGSNNWYIGIWYANIQEKTIVWVANRETPARNRPGVLMLSRQGDLGLFDAEGASLWSVNISNKASQAVILDSDTYLPGMRFGGLQKLVSWKSSFDPAPGLFSFHLDPSGAKQLVLTWNNSVQYWVSGTWNGKFFSEIPEMTTPGMSTFGFYNISVGNTSSGLYVNYTLFANANPLIRSVLTKSGNLQPALFHGSKWDMFTFWPRDQCAVYGLCGAYGICNSNNLQFCSCVEGFTPSDNRAWDSQEWWSSGCVRQSPLNCGAKNGSTDGFIDSSATVAPTKNDYASSYTAVAPTKKDCEKACLRNCSCTAFTFNPPSGPCQIWSGDLLNLRNSPSKNNSNVSIRVAASALPYFDPNSKLQTATSVGVVLGIVSALAVAWVIFSSLRKRRYRLRSMERCVDSSNSFLRMFTYKELKMATRNFRSKLGSGGFGSVFKGSLTDGTLVAVKKLEGSRQDDKQFRAEITSLGNIQHGNFSPKLADFGLAKLVSRDLSRILTTTRGTRGYLAPEWISGLPITPKVDVYSFGITLFEIISGRRSLDLEVQDSSKFYFPAWAATQIYQGKTINIVEEGVAEEKDIEEVRRASVVALLCIEKDEEVRPSMGQVVLMLEGRMDPQTLHIRSFVLMDNQADRRDTDSDSIGDVIS